MGDAYPELAKARAHVEKVLKKEELRFAETLDQGDRPVSQWRQALSKLRDGSYRRGALRIDELEQFEVVRGAPTFNEFVVRFAAAC